MNAMMLARIHDLNKTEAPLVWQTVPIPTPGDQEILIRVMACGVCHTELDEIEGRTPPPRFPVIPGHQVVGRAYERHATATAGSDHRHHAGLDAGGGGLEKSQTGRPPGH